MAGKFAQTENQSWGPSMDNEKEFNLVLDWEERGKLIADLQRRLSKLGAKNRKLHALLRTYQPYVENTKVDPTVFDDDIPF
jgi:hypothetical protein